MAYVSRSPPIITDGQISRVRFETLAFFRRPSRVWRGFKRWSVYIPAILVCLQPRLLTVVALRRFYQAGRHTAEVAAKCPEPLCPTSVLPLLGRCECHLLRGRYPSVIAPTGSCATPNGLSPASVLSLVRRVLAGCTQSLLPPGALRIFPWMLDPVPRRYIVCSHLFLPRCHRPSPSEEWVGFPRFVPRKRLLAGPCFEDADIPLCSGLQVCSPPRSFLPLRYCRRAAGDFTSGPIVLCYLHTHRIC